MNPLEKNREDIQADIKMACAKEGDDGTWILLRLGGRAKMAVPAQSELTCWWWHGLNFLSSTNGKSNWAFLCTCPDVAQQGREGWGKFKSCQWFYAKRESFYYLGH